MNIYFVQPWCTCLQLRIKSMKVKMQTGPSPDNITSINLKTQPGPILALQISSINLKTNRAYPGALAYKMSKAAMDQLTRCSALEV